MEFMLVWMRGILTSHILISQKRIQGDTSHILWSRCASVWNIFLFLIFLVLLWSWFSLFWLIALEVWAIFLSSFFSILWNLHVFHSFSSFLLLFWELHVSLFFSIAPYFFLAYENFGENYSWQMNGVFIWWMEKACFCVTLSVRVSILFVGVRVSWSWAHDKNLNKGQNNLTKLNAITSSIWVRFLHEYYVIWPW